MARLVLVLFFSLPLQLAAANNADDDGFVWLDANTRIKQVKPVSAAAGATKAPAEEPRKAKKAEKRKK
jgi:hypothetical protein